MGRSGQAEAELDGQKQNWMGRSRTGWAEAELEGQKQNWMGRSRTRWAEAELDRQYWTGKTGQAELDRLKTDRTRQAGRTGLAKDRQN
jgi:hypothetical protein